jgi:asparaginyl-tRNA synthetase
VVGWVDDPETYPMQPKRHTLEFLREHRPPARAHQHLRRGDPRAQLPGAGHPPLLPGRGLLWIHTPIITASDAEGAGEMFRVSTLDMANLPRTPDGKVDYSQDFFGREAFLTVSGQLNVETYCMALSKVYTFGPTFRAENSNTTRHLPSSG